MRKKENLNLLNRLISIFLLTLCLGVIGFSFYKVFTLKPEAIVLDTIALVAVTLFCLFEMVFIIMGKKKDSVLEKIVFEENQRINSFPLIAVIIGTLFGLGLSILGLFLYLTRDDVSAKTNVLIILSISFYLFMNCVMYFIFLLMFRKRKFDIKDLIK